MSERTKTKNTGNNSSNRRLGNVPIDDRQLDLMPSALVGGEITVLWTKYI